MKNRNKIQTLGTMGIEIMGIRKSIF